MNKILEMFGEPITYGGQESVVYNMLSSFNLKDDFVIDLYTPYYANNKNLINLINNNHGNVYHDDIDFRLNDNRLRLAKFVDIFFNTHNDYDVVHIHTGSSTTMYVYAKIAKKHKIKKVIVHSHTTGFKISLFFRFRRFIINLLMRKYVDVYLACSEQSIQYKFNDYYSSKPIVVYNGIDVNKYKFNIEYRTEIRNKYNINDKYLIGILGRLSFEKNIFFLLDILSELLKINNKFYLMIAGDGDYYNSLRDKCNELNIDNNVIFVGKVEDSYKYYSAFDIFCMPSFYEGMPVTAIEAQTSGLKCLISSLVTKECAISSETEFISISNKELWVNKILEYLNTNNYNTQILNRKSNNINFDKFDRNKTFKIVENIYKS